MSTQQISQPSAKPPRPKGGHPKSRVKTEPIKFDRATRIRVARLVLDQGLTKAEAAAATGVSDIVVRTEVAREQGRREARADPPVDIDTLSRSAREKFDAAMRQYARKLEAEFEDAYRLRLQDALSDTVLPSYNETKRKYEQVIKSRKGVMDKATFNKIRRCLHPDSRRSVSDDVLSEAFHLFAKLELVLLDESQLATAAPPLPTNYNELMELRRKVQAERKAIRTRSNIARR